MGTSSPGCGSCVRAAPCLHGRLGTKSPIGGEGLSEQVTLQGSDMAQPAARRGRGSLFDSNRGTHCLGSASSSAVRGTITPLLLTEGCGAMRDFLPAQEMLLGKSFPSQR